MFDLRTEIVDPKTKAVSRQPYRMHVQLGLGVIYERPIGSGEWFYSNGQEVPLEAIPQDLLPESKRKVQAVQTAKTPLPSKT